jgi:phosphoglycerate dehydrogenase-like enzyme
MLMLQSYANTRSVAEMVIAEMVCLARQLGDRNRECHLRTWCAKHSLNLCHPEV